MHNRIFACGLAALMAFTLACSNTPAGPTSPSTTDGSADAPALPDGSTLKVSAPTPVSPVGGVEVTDLDPDLVITNSTPTFFPGSLNLSYVFEVRNEEGRVVYTSVAVPQGGGQTRHEIARDLNANEVHTWQAWAVFQGRQGPKSASATFKTFDRFGVSCAHLGSEVEIVACRKAQYGQIPHDALPEFLAKVAHDLNRGGFEHRPYGRLIKTTGANCHGYSCDIICSNAGGTHRQWDILIDEDQLQGPVWNRVGEPTARPCEPVE
jgi:hypothetical protein